jgi:hypothetical protein
VAVAVAVVGVRDGVARPRAISHRFTGKAAAAATASATARLPQNSGSASPASMAPGHGEHHRVVHHLHDGDRRRVGGQGEAERRAQAEPGAQQRQQGERVAEGEGERGREGDGRAGCPSRGRCRAPCPSTSPMPQPVRQCSVAESASRFRPGGAAGLAPVVGEGVSARP